MTKRMIILIFSIALFLSCDLEQEYTTVEFNIQRWFIDNGTDRPSVDLEIRIIGTFNNWGENNTDITEIWNNALETTYYDGEIKYFTASKKLTVGDSHQYTLLVKYIYLGDYIETIEYVDTKWLNDNKNITVTPMDKFVESSVGFVDYYTEFEVK